MSQCLTVSKVIIYLRVINFVIDYKSKHRSRFHMNTKRKILTLENKTENKTFTNAQAFHIQDAN